MFIRSTHVVYHRISKSNYDLTQLITIVYFEKKPISSYLVILRQHPLSLKQHADKALEVRHKKLFQIHAK